MQDLTKQKCVACEGGVEPLKRAEFQQYLDAVNNWLVVHNDLQIEKEFVFKNFKQALVFINKVGEIAESEGHHPDMYLHNFKKVKISLMTHAIGGLSTNDFILAAKIDAIASS
ncbi:4a-hydroxytetrahydrobiopterin dehydratase [Candidatus Microgenomates bacterium]|nr:MAG: 4a-hydroxytetrahydrobiopterin dehydratase [Candidatus Microgenomates bacterium]